MKNLSTTQQYFLCVLKKNGKISSLEMEKTTCLAASAIVELLMDNILTLDGKKLSVQAPLPEDKSYLRQVYYVVMKKQPVKFESVMEYFSFNFTDKYMDGLIEDIGESLVNLGCVQKEKGGFMNGKTLYIPNADDVDHIVQNIRAELLEEGEISEDIVVLTALLNKSGDLQRYFSSYEKQALKKRLEEIRENPQNELIRKATEYIDTLFLLFIVAIS
ncbi:hypothetical protein B5F07_01595 [Lachnoclostridium sp. An169]|uniref:GOLPH3/VPS74 family protein n=1 Tax=Lachnoclostridium sp. An169 TaxID=1965569 RepID=UPI000B36AF16|nr:GPP34 family phosphoprotein [Lachnoclostridium sp. An169]OUP86708.1 hypothetical protein B5F07_01595 [Lachnoclostridium sp. An169]